MVANIVILSGKITEEQFHSYILDEGVFLAQEIAGLSRTLKGNELEEKTREALKVFYFILEEIHVLTQQAIGNAQNDISPRDALIKFFDESGMHSESFYGEIPNNTLQQFQLLLLGVFMGSITRSLEVVNSN